MGFLFVLPAPGRTLGREEGKEGRLRVTLRRGGFRAHPEPGTLEGSGSARRLGWGGRQR